MAVRVDVVFDVPETSPYHGPTLDALRHAADALDVVATISAVGTDTIDDAYFDDLPDAVVIGPGTPYASPPAAERVIATARERGIPLVAT